ncbi:MAG TPA: type II secretion system F family protein [Symbiobacteriaceae bacterium]|jgi:tight adherence protein B|nr:type II secretion system F family protein [Symbiobacteriaceae bacterium]
MLIFFAGLLVAGAIWLIAAPPPAAVTAAVDDLPPETPAQRLERYLHERRIPLTPRQYRLMSLLVPVGTFLVVWALTGGVLTAVFCLPAGPLVTRGILDALSRNRTRLLRDQLQEALLSLSTSLKVGQSLPNALERCVSDLRRLHPHGAPIIEELGGVVQEIRLGTPVDVALVRLRDSLPLEEVANLVDAVVMTRRRGGNIVEVMGNVSHMIADRMAVDREIQVLTAQKRTEASILAMLPVAIYLLQRLTSPTYLAVFHDTAGGQIVLGLIFLMVIIGYWMATRMAAIEV